MNNRLSLAALALLAFSGCANDPAPTEQLRLTEQAMHQAKAVGASEQIVELKLAEERLVQAQAAMTEGEFKQARILAEQAELDARLAEARMLTHKSETQLAALNLQIKRLRTQLGDLQ
ncbi:MAG TPA: DUF4398 domain-containing protein [Pseudomonas sp.]|nr:DUF4398 domain-containing protein [Pseudomonas sp.]